MVTKDAPVSFPSTRRWGLMSCMRLILGETFDVQPSSDNVARPTHTSPRVQRSTGWCIRSGKGKGDLPSWLSVSRSSFVPNAPGKDDFIGPQPAGVTAGRHVRRRLGLRPTGNIPCRTGVELPSCQTHHDDPSTVARRQVCGCHTTRRSRGVSKSLHRSIRQEMANLPYF